MKPGAGGRTVRGAACESRTVVRQVEGSLIVTRTNKPQIVSEHSKLLILTSWFLGCYVITSCDVVNRYELVGGTCCRHLQRRRVLLADSRCIKMMEVAGSSETRITIHSVEPNNSFIQYQLNMFRPTQQAETCCCVRLNVLWFLLSKIQLRWIVFKL